MTESVKHNFAELVGGTPLMEMRALADSMNLRARVLAKLEYFEPAGSVKDRVALKLIEDALARGLIAPGATLIEPTSGNTGIGLAAVGASMGYKVVLTMPDTMSVERRKLLSAYGAELVLTPGALGMRGAIEKAEELKAQTPNSIIPGQFVNPANPRAHYEGTGPELYRQAGGQIDAFVAGVGTGGTITGIGRYLKEKNPSVYIAGVEPAASRVLAGGKAGPHGLQGIGANFVPEVLDRSVLDEVIPVTEEDAYRIGRLAARREGILIGVSSGAALFAALTLAKRPEFEGKTVAVLLPDGGDKYLSTPMFDA